LLFVALGDDPVSFDRAVADVAEKMRHQGLEDAKLAKSIRYTVRANWKLIFENNRECYHCNTAHPEYVQGTYDTARFSAQMLPEVERQERLAAERFAHMGLGDATASSEMTGAYWRAARSPLMEGWVTQSLDGLSEFLAARERRSCGRNAHHAGRRDDFAGRCLLVRAQGRG
jgi:Rieske 2Fe-2S family protein